MLSHQGVGARGPPAPAATPVRVTVPIRLLDERRFDPPRDVEVHNDGRWWSGHQTAWRLCDDEFGWRAAVPWRQLHDHGWDRHLTSVPPERVRLRAQ